MNERLDDEDEDEDDDDFYDDDDDFDDEDEDEDELEEEDEEEDIEEEESEEIEDREEEFDEPLEEEEAVQAASPIKEQKRLETSLDQVDVEVVVELGHLQLSAKELLALAKGNVLDLGTSLEGSVDLVVNGKRFGRGELMRMGDLLGVRILELHE